MSNKFRISYDTTSYVKVGETIKLNAEYLSCTEYKLIWLSLDEEIASVIDGIVTGEKEGYAHIRVYPACKESDYIDFLVTVISKNISK